MSDPALEVVEFLLTAHVYTDDRSLDENDLPPRYRRVFWADEEDADDGDGEERPGSGDEMSGGIERPLVVTERTARQATGVEHPWDAVSDLLFTEKENFSGRLSLTQADMAINWVVERVDHDRLATNPTLASVVADRDDVDVTLAEAREQTRPIHADRVWIDSLLDAYFDEDDDAEMLDLVQVRAPEEIEMTLDDLVLTADQEGEIQKIGKAIEHREYLAEIGLREIGKLLFVGPPGTGKTTASRALAHELGQPFVEVKLSMITSQYLGETAKNVEKTFEVAKRLSPCILFIDEFD
ncbi:MAG: ATP-binding protein, partial [Haloplanus sp.]